jgi:hypothetical protein
MVVKSTRLYDVLLMWGKQGMCDEFWWRNTLKYREGMITFKWKSSQKFYHWVVDETGWISWTLGMCCQRLYFKSWLAEKFSYWRVSSNNVVAAFRNLFSYSRSPGNLMSFWLPDRHVKQLTTCNDGNWVAIPDSSHIAETRQVYPYNSCVIVNCFRRCL